MPYVTVGEENANSIQLYYEDHGSGQPVVLVHGYPLDGHSWEKQLPALLDKGYRVITYDRRGFGHSSQPVTGYDYDTFAADLKALVDKLDLHDMILAGFSMGTGEVTRYLGTYGSGRVVTKAALFGAIPPFLLQTDDNPEGVPQSLFDGFMADCRKDRYAWLKSFLDNLYNMDELRGTLVSSDAWNGSFQVACTMSSVATLACIPTWLTDFRADVAKIDVPLLVVHGTDDRVLPIDNTSRRLPGLVKDMRLVEVEGGPHNIGWTHADQLNKAFLDFLAE